MTRLFLPLLLLPLLLLLGMAGTIPAPAVAQEVRVPLAIETADGARHVFQVELADEPEERQSGLMFRQEMARDHGMLFDFGRARKITMWMRNTPLPLDMIFADSDGRIVHIHENAVPYSEATISSRRRAKYTLEVNAGVARDLGLTPGDRLMVDALPD